MSSSVIALFRREGFDDKATLAMGQAFDMVCRELHDTGQSELVKEALAKQIIKAANTGERDPERLCDAALRAVGITTRR